MKLVSKLNIPNPRKLILAFVEHWYPVYDAVPVDQDNELSASDIALSTMLMSRISGVTGGYIFRATEPINAALKKIPANVDLLDVVADDEIPGADGISQAITAMCAVKRAKLAVSTKILHKKRPGLIHIFDSVVKKHYARLCPSVSERTWGDYAIALTRLVHKDMLSVASELRDLEGELKENHTPLTPCRILNALIWIVKSRNEKWIVEQAAKEKAIRQLSLDFSSNEKVVEYVGKVMELIGNE
jgi:hypothetical protein